MLAKRVAYNTFAQIFGKILGFFISGILLVIVAQHLGTYNMGNYVTIIAFVGFFVTLSDLGANLIMVREISQNEQDRVRITGEFFGFRLTFSLFIMLLAPLVALFIPQYSGLIVKGLLIATAAQFLLLLNQLYISMLQTQLQLDRGVLAELANRVVTLAIVFEVARRGVTGADFFFAFLYATLIGAAVNLAITAFFARRLWPVRPRVDLTSWKRTMVTIAPVGLFTFLGVIHFKADTIILSLIKNPTEVGIYGYAYKIAEILFTFPTMFVGAVFPRLSQLLVTERTKFNRFAQATFDALLIGTLPFLTFVFLGAKYFTVLLSRSSYTDGILAGNSLGILTVAMAAWFIGTLFIHILIMANDYKGLIRNLAIAAVVNIGLNLILIPRFSYYGAAITTCVTEFLMLSLTILYTRQRVGFTAKLTYLPITVAATVVMSVALVVLFRLPFANLTSFAGDSRLDQMLFIVGAASVAAAAYFVVFWPFAGRSLLQGFRSGEAQE